MEILQFCPYFIVIEFFKWNIAKSSTYENQKGLRINIPRQEKSEFS